MSASAVLLQRQQPPLRAEGNAIPDKSEISKLRNWGGPRANSGGARPGAGRKPKAPAAIVPMPLGIRWYVIETYPQAERQAAYDLARQGWRAYLPLIAVRKRDRITPTMFHKALVPMFGGYLFVQFDRDAGAWGPIRECQGVRNVLRDTHGKPQPITSGFVEALISGDADRLELKEARREPRPVGQIAAVEVGMSRCAGTVTACDGRTTNIQVEMFGRPVVLELPAAQVLDLEDGR